MKIFYLLLVTFILISQSVNGQRIKNIGSYHTKEVVDENLNYFKIKSIECSFDTSNNFFVEGRLLFTYSKDSTVFYEVYRNRYLFVSYYLLPHDGFASSIGPSARNKKRLDVFDLRRPEVRWSFDLDNNYRTNEIVSFDADRGYLKLKKVKASKMLNNNFWKL
ncbi:MAG: hypothetical protein ACK4E0_03405 [Chitinophagaceae bacterium]